MPVVQHADVTPGEPILVVRGAIFNTFGACATAQDDGSALIYDVAPGHPLGLQRGDRIVGYDGRPWRELVPELLAAELPVAGAGAPRRARSSTRSCSPRARTGICSSTIDILKQATGRVEHRSTAALNTSRRCAAGTAPSGCRAGRPKAGGARSTP